MQKDFDSWNKTKQYIHTESQNKFYHRRDIWWCSLGVNVGFEQDGTGVDYERPVLILKGFSKQVCLILPLTTSKKKNPYYISIGRVKSKDSFVITSQIKLIDTRRLTNKIGVLDQETFELIRKAVKDLL